MFEQVENCGIALQLHDWRRYIIVNVSFRMRERRVLSERHTLPKANTTRRYCEPVDLPRAQKMREKYEISKTGMWENVKKMYLYSPSRDLA